MVMQDYADFARKNGVELKGEGPCQFCGAATTRGVHECVELFSLGFQQLDYSQPDSHLFRFISVDAHTLQHSEIHGRWNNHFHLTRQHLIFHHKVDWTYALSPLLSDHLKAYKAEHPNERLTPPDDPGRMNIVDVVQRADSALDCKQLIWRWGHTVYLVWSEHHPVVAPIAQRFVEAHGQRLRTRKPF